MSVTDFVGVVMAIRDIFTGVAAVVAAGVAVAGLKTWKRQLHGNAEYDLARRLLRVTYKLREAINFVRVPFIPAGEMDKALEDTGLKDASVTEREKRVQELVYQARWKPVAQARIEFDAELLEAEALWGPEMQRLGLAIKQCMGELVAALQRYLSHRMPDDPELFNAIDNIVFGTEDDEYTKKLQGAIAAIENSLRPHLKL
ncbi:MAG: hypothetical protein LLG20_27180 [Acidobacteriales bacterium]|nr:hypothetical protein [Terriglobales bacterium]